MGNFDLILVVHPEDKRNPKGRYIFKAPAFSGISENDYVITDDNGTLGKVVSVLENINEDSDTLKFIRSISSLGDKKIKPICHRLIKVTLLDDGEKDESDNQELCKDENGKIHDRASRILNILNSDFNLGTKYYSIDQSYGLSREIFSNGEYIYFLHVEQYTYCGCDADYARINIGNIFFNKNEAEEIARIIMENKADKTEPVNIEKELAKIL